MATTQTYKCISDNAPIKSKQSLFASNLGTLKKDSLIEIISISGLWAYFKFNNKDAYILTIYIQKSQAVVTGSTTIRYLNSDTKAEIASPITNSNLALKSYTYTAPTISNYTVVEPSTKSVTLTTANPNQEVIFYYTENKIYGSIIINYIDKDSGLSIAPSETHNNIELGTYSYNSIDITGYKLSTVSSQSVTLTKDSYNQTITFEYNKILGSITIKYMDVDTKAEISTSESYTGLELKDYSYNAKSIDGYTVVEPSSKSVTLISSDYNQNIIFYYKVNKVYGSVAINYIDKATNNSIAPSVTKNNLELVTYSYDAIAVDGYKVSGASSKSVTLTKEMPNQSITFEYDKVEEVITPIDPEKENEIPYISTYYFNPKPYDNQDIIIPIYITDYNQVEYYNNDTSLRFKLRVEVDGNVTYIDNLPAGDYNANLGKLSEGEHWFSLQVIDQYNRESQRLFNDLWVINKDKYTITSAQTYTITESDLTQYKIKNNNSQVLDDMVNNRVGLSNLFKDLKDKGYRKCILPNGIYRVNRALRLGTGDNTPINIPSNFTVDMNKSTFKLHPYNDSEYGKIAQTENLIVRFQDCTDSHLINGTIEGDYAERKVNGWISGSNGEQNNGLSIYGGKYNSIENMKITQITGYNTCTYFGTGNGSGKLGSFVDSIKIVDGIETASQGYTTSDYCDLTNILDNKYICVSVWLAFGGIKGKYWDIDLSFYDSNKQFIETIKVYQFRRCRIPKNSLYVRITFRCLSSEIGSLSIHSQPSSRYCEIKNVEYVDNRTCAAPFQFQHLLMDNCNFTRSGQSITPAAIDLEDGWEQQQDFFLRNSKIVEGSGTADIIDNAGLNHVVENCTGFRMIFRYRINGLTVRNNTNCTFSNTIGYMTKNTERFYNNKNVTGISLGVTENEFYGYENTKFKLKNNEFVLGYVDRASKGFFTIDESKVTLTGGHSNINIEDSEVTIKGTACYIGGGIYMNNCKFTLATGQTFSKFSFNALNAIRQYTNCIYDTPCQFVSHNMFNSGTWSSCTFNDTLLISTNNDNNMGDISFNNCTFNKDVTLTLKNNAKVQFANCKFNGNIIYNNDAKANSEFNNCTFK